MIYLATVIIVLLLFVSVIQQKSITNPLSIFLGIWSMICFLASLRLFGMYEYSAYGPLIVTIGVLFVFLGYYFGQRIKIKRTDKPSTVETRFTLRNKLYVILVGSAIAVYLVILVAVITLYRYGYSASTIREFYRYSGESTSSGRATDLIYGGSKVLRWLHTYFANPIVYASLPIMAIDLVKNAKITKVSLLAIAALGLSCVVNFGRFNLIYALICIVLAFFLNNKDLKQRTKRKIIRVSIAAIVAIVVFLIIINNLRNTASEFTFAKHFYAYFSIEIPLIDYWIKYVNSYHYYSYGFSSISGLVANLMNVLAKYNISFSAYRVNELLNYNLVDHFVRVFPDQQYNAYVSMFFAFYLDFRELGVVTGSFIYGVVVSKSYKRAKTNYRSQAFYLLLFYSLLTSFIRWQFILVGYVFSFIFLYILIKREIIVIEKE